MGVIQEAETTKKHQRGDAKQQRSVRNVSQQRHKCHDKS